jgi:hypothetical protein
MSLLFSLGWEHVIVHSHDHRNENYGVVEEMQFNAGDPELDDTDRDRRTEKIVSGDGLPLQQSMLDVVPELNAERDRPPH